MRFNLYPYFFATGKTSVHHFRHLTSLGQDSGRTANYDLRQRMLHVVLDFQS